MKLFAVGCKRKVHCYVAAEEIQILLCGSLIPILLSFLMTINEDIYSAQFGCRPQNVQVNTLFGDPLQMLLAVRVHVILWCTCVCACLSRKGIAEAHGSFVVVLFITLIIIIIGVNPVRQGGRTPTAHDSLELSPFPATLGEEIQANGG